MSREHLPEAEPESLQAGVRPGKAGRFQVGVRGLIVAVAASGLMAWAGRTIWEELHPAIAAARGFRSRDPGDRMQAVAQLVTLGPVDPDRVISSLIAALGDTDPEVRISAAAVLGTIGNKLIRTHQAPDQVRAGLCGLIGALRDREPSVRIAVAGALPSFTVVKGWTEAVDIQAVIDALVPTIEDPEEAVRLAGLRAMAGCGWAAPAGPPAALISAMREDRSPPNRSAAIEALGRFQCPLDPWLGSLLWSVEHDPEVRPACESVFTRTGPAFSADAIPQLVAALGSPSRIVRSYAARGLYPHANDLRAAPAIPMLLHLIREPIDPELASGRGKLGSNGDPAVHAAHLLAGLAPRTGAAGEAIEALTEIVRSGHASRKEAAIAALGIIGPAAEPAVPTLIEALRRELARPDDSPGYRYAGDVARSLGQIAPGRKSADESLSALIEVLDARPRWRSDQWLVETQIKAISAILEFETGSQGVLARLRALRESPFEAVRNAADRAMTTIEGAEPVPPGEHRRR
jgi:HEAT repeat protein